MLVEGNTPVRSLEPMCRVTRGPGHADTPAKIRLLCNRFPLNKPKHTDVIHATVNGVRWSFGAGKFLNSLARHYIGTVKSRPLCITDRENLDALPWFAGWVEKLDERRVVASGVEPTTDDKVNMLLNDGGFDVPVGKVGPAPTEPTAVVDRYGRYCEVDPGALMVAIAPNFDRGGLAGTHPDHLSETTKQRVRQRSYVDRRWGITVTQMSDVVVPKDSKIELVLNHYASAPPAWNESLPVCAPGVNGVVFFYPGHWLDSLIHNWVPPSRERNFKRKVVVLSGTQRAALEMLPWFAGWVESVKVACGDVGDENRKRNREW